MPRIQSVPPPPSLPIPTRPRPRQQQRRQRRWRQRPRWRLQLEAKNLSGVFVTARAAAPQQAGITWIRSGSGLPPRCRNGTGSILEAAEADAVRTYDAVTQGHGNGKERPPAPAGCNSKYGW